MLNETASHAGDRTILRTAGKLPPRDDNPLRDDLRQRVMAVFAIENEVFYGTLNADGSANEPLLMLSDTSRLLATFEGQLLLGSEAAYDQLDEALLSLNCLPLFREANGKEVIHIVEGRPRPQERPIWLNVVLFVATLVSVLIVGTQIAINEIAYNDMRQAQGLIANFWFELWRGLPYALSILLILGAHELGHYFMARRHHLSVTLPYFIPAPFISLIGTFGAFIQLRQPMRNRKVLLDVGAAGPLTGLVFAIPILFIGLATSTVGPITPGGILEGNSLLYALAKVITFGRFLPDGQVDVYVNQLAWAGWTGLLVTALNLIPIGQLDGGHILYSLIGNWARRLYFPLLAAMIALVFVSDAWLFWLILLFLFGRVYATPLDMITPLDARRRAIAILGLVVFAVTFVPVPFSTAELGTALPSGGAWALPVTIGLLARWLRR